MSCLALHHAVPGCKADRAVGHEKVDLAGEDDEVVGGRRRVEAVFVVFRRPLRTKLRSGLGCFSRGRLVARTLGEECKDPEVRTAGGWLKGRSLW